MEELELIKAKMREFVEDIDSPYVSNMYKNINHGKMLRSKLILNIAPQKESILLASVIELIHQASLVHDDIIDESETRRGNTSTYVSDGIKNAVMLGDILYSKAYNELSSLDNRIVKYVSNAVVKLSVGEIEDVRYCESINEDEDMYISMIYKKTASLIEASSYSAAILSGQNAENFAKYGRNLGILFQIVDDVLDVISDDKTLGKPAMNDYKEGKMTLPYIYAFKNFDKIEKDKLKAMYKKDLTKEDKAWMKEALVKNGAITYSLDRAKKYGEEAIKLVDNKKLISIVKDMIERDF